MKLRHPSKYPKLRYVKGQFSCGMFGVCSDVVLSPGSIVSRPEDQQNPCSCSEDKENRDFQVTTVAATTSGSDKERHRLQQFQRVPSSTQWELALKNGRTRSLKSRYSELIDLSPLQASAADTLSTCSSSSETCDLDYFIAQLRAGNYGTSTFKALRHFVNESELDRRLMVELGVHNEVVSVLADQVEVDGTTEAMEEAFAVVVCLASDEAVRKGISKETAVFKMVRKLLEIGTAEGKIEAATLLVKLAENEELVAGISTDSGIVEAVVELLKARSEARVVKAAIKGLLALCLSKENRSLASRMGAVPVLMGLLEDFRGVNAERCLACLELLCTTREGKEAAAEHVPVVVRMILRVSDRGTEYAAGVLCSVCTPENVRALDLAFQARASTHLLLLLQSRCTDRARRKALKLLKVLHNFGETKISKSIN